MKKTSLNFTCSESFDSMENVGKNSKYCSKCNIIVRDHSKEADISEITKCGKYNINQLDLIKRISTLFNYSKPIALLSLLGLVTTTAYSDSKFEINPELKSIVKQNTTTIKGKIVNNKTGEKLPFVEVTAVVKQEVIFSTISDINGNFTINIDTEKHSILDIFIHFDFDGFKTNVTSYQSLPEDLNIKMEARIANISDEEVIICATGRSSGLINVETKELDSLIDSIEWSEENEEITEDKE
ncbi:carboxypeptidase-like regulatory domain-containing protein [Flavobacteriaceae bacterium]|nr:carboxypeptidase-like regulatory domain-containing protein [Flavobacteriaceae bacterium]